MQTKKAFFVSIKLAFSADLRKKDFIAYRFFWNNLENRMTNLEAKQDNLENKSQINPLLARATGNKIKRILARATGNKSKSVVADNKMKRILVALKPLTISKAKNTREITSLQGTAQESKNLPKIVGDIRHYPPANKE